MKATGVKRLTIEFISRLAIDAAKADGSSGSLVGRVGAQIANMGVHAREARERVKASLAAVRSAADYDPEVCGRTDDEIADRLCAAIDERRTSS